MCDMCSSGYYDDAGRYIGPAEQAHLDRAADDEFQRWRDDVLDAIEWGMKRRGEM